MDFGTTSRMVESTAAAVRFGVDKEEAVDKLLKFCERLEQLQEAVQTQRAAFSKKVVKRVPVAWVGVASEVKLMGEFDSWTRGFELSAGDIDSDGVYKTFEANVPLLPGQCLGTRVEKRVAEGAEREGEGRGRCRRQPHVAVAACRYRRPDQHTGRSVVRCWQPDRNGSWRRVQPMLHAPVCMGGAARQHRPQHRLHSAGELGSQQEARGLLPLHVGHVCARKRLLVVQCHLHPAHARVCLDLDLVGLPAPPPCSWASAPVPSPLPAPHLPPSFCSTRGGRHVRLVGACIHVCMHACMPAGKYRVKFLVDGQWRQAADWPTISNEAGETDNLLVVTPP